MGNTSAECKKALRLRQKEADPEFMKKESERTSLLQKRQRAVSFEKEWRQNNHKRLALYTKECQVSELKEKLLEGFNIYQKHVQAVMYPEFFWADQYTHQTNISANMAGTD